MVLQHKFLIGYSLARKKKTICCPKSVTIYRVWSGLDGHGRPWSDSVGLFLGVFLGGASTSPIGLTLFK